MLSVGVSWRVGERSKEARRQGGKEARRQGGKEARRQRIMGDEKYIYCVIEASARLEFGPIGLGEKPVYTIGLGGLAFVVSEAVLDEYIANTLNLGEHERVLERVMRDQTILPMRFGTVAKSEKEIMLMLKRHHAAFLRMLKKLTNKVEVEVEVFWRDMKSVFNEIIEASPKLKRLKSDANPKMRDEVIMAGQMVYQLLQEKKKKETEGFIKRLKRFAVDYMLNQCIGDEFVMKGSFLIDKVRLGEFDLALDMLDKEKGEKLRIRYIGPTPPYSFASMRVR